MANEYTSMNYLTKKKKSAKHECMFFLLMQSQQLVTTTTKTVPSNRTVKMKCLGFFAFVLQTFYQNFTFSKSLHFVNIA